MSRSAVGGFPGRNNRFPSALRHRIYLLISFRILSGNVQTYVLNRADSAHQISHEGTLISGCFDPCANFLMEVESLAMEQVFAVNACFVEVPDAFIQVKEELRHE